MIHALKSSAIFECLAYSRRHWQGQPKATVFLDGRLSNDQPLGIHRRSTCSARAPGSLNNTVVASGIALGSFPA